MSGSRGRPSGIRQFRQPLFSRKGQRSKLVCSCSSLAVWIGTRSSQKARFTSLVIPGIVGAGPAAGARGPLGWLIVSVAMEATASRITAERYYELTVEGDRKQLVDGRIVVNEPKTIHALLQMRISVALGGWVDGGERRGMALLPTDIRMDDFNVYGPDVLWFRQERIPADMHAYPDHVPDLVVEIRSPGTWRYDVGAKKRVYEGGGLPELWLVDDRSQSVLVYRRTRPHAPTFDVALELGRDDTLDSPLLPGFGLALDELFRRSV
jgi:Uma2 family endonuclease